MKRIDCKALENAFDELVQDYNELLEAYNFIENEMTAYEVTVSKCNKFKSVLSQYISSEDIDKLELEAIEEAIYDDRGM